MKKIKSVLISLVAIAGIASVSVATPTLVSAQQPSGGGSSATSAMEQGVKDVGGTNNTRTLQDNIKIITNVLLFIIGAIAVIMIIVGGIRYVTSNGDSSAIKGAKDTILYAVVGLVVAIMAYAIVNFVITAFK